MAIRQGGVGRGTGPTGSGAVRSKGARPLSRAELERLEQEFKDLSGDDREAAAEWIEQLRPKLAKILSGA